MKKNRKQLDINRPQFQADTHNGLPLQNTLALKRKLLAELLELEHQRNRLASESDGVDFSMIQTYKEMIQSRRAMFKELSR